MTIKEQLYYLIEKYHSGEYDTKTFAEQFEIIYCLEGNEAGLSNKEYKLFSELSKITGRYSSFEEDQKSYPGVYYTDEDVKTKAEEIFMETKKIRQK